jgi:hypothetical protein
MLFTTTLAAFLAATASGVAALGPILPPNDPSSNGPDASCASREECLTAINNVRADQEGLDPITLPTNWDSLTYQERIFTFTNLERVSRGLNPLTHLVNIYSSAIKTAVTNGEDPWPTDSESNAVQWSSIESIWAGGDGMIPLGAMYGWMYYDGPGGFNIDCTSSDTSGCWGHRNNILAKDATIMDAGAGKQSNGQESYAALLVGTSDTPNQAQTVLTWAQQKEKST